MRGDLLLKRDPANSSPAEDAFLTAIAIAKQQGARSFELRAALSMTRLYWSTVRRAEAHAVLAPAIGGFPPTTAMPEIAEAQGLLTALAATDEVKVDAAHRRRRYIRADESVSVQVPQHFAGGDFETDRHSLTLGRSACIVKVLVSQSSQEEERRNRASKPSERG